MEAIVLVLALALGVVVTLLVFRATAGWPRVVLVGVVPVLSLPAAVLFGALFGPDGSGCSGECLGNWMLTAATFMGWDTGILVTAFILWLLRRKERRPQRPQSWLS